MAFFHQTVPLTKEQFIGIALSQGGLEALLKRGFTKDEIGITTFEASIHSAPIPLYSQMNYNYQVIFGVK